MRCFILLVQLLGACSCVFSQNTWFVSPNGAGGAGNTWLSAFPDVSQALNIAQYGDTIWVAEGVYYPTTTTNRSASFILKKGVKLLGGFAGNETAAAQRNPALHPSVLSGNIGDTNLVTDNVYHVVQGYGLDANTVLDGFVISDGNSEDGGNSLVDGYGAGIFLSGESQIVDSKPLIVNCVIENNRSGYGGGGMMLAGIEISNPSNYYLINPVLKRCIFRNNRATYNGGGLLKEGRTAPGDTLLWEDCNFVDNYAFALSGGGACFSYSNRSCIYFKKCRFESNTTLGGEGGGFSWPNNNPEDYAAFLRLDSCVFLKNSAPEAGGFGYNVTLLNNSAADGFFLINDCVFEENIAKDETGSIFLLRFGGQDKMKVAIDRCRFAHNIANSYLAATIFSYHESEVIVRLSNSLFWANHSEGGPQYYMAGFNAGGNKVDSHIDNCIFAYNGAAVFSGSYKYSQNITRITNCTFFRNGEVNPYGLRWHNEFTGNPNAYNFMYFKNCIMWEPGVTELLFYNNNDPFPTNLGFIVDYCSIHYLPPAAVQSYGFILGDSIYFNTYPDFVDTTVLDFRLKKCGAGVGKGELQAVLDAGLETDYAGQPRVRFGRPDLGAYESQDSCFYISAWTPEVLPSSRVYPNPARSNAGITVDAQLSAFDMVSWRLYDTSGRSCFAGHGIADPSGQLHIKAPKTGGVYLLELQIGREKRQMKLVVMPENE